MSEAAPSKAIYRRAVWMVILGGACLSLLGIADRTMDCVSGPQIVLYRAAGQTLFFSLVFFFMRRAPMKAEFTALGIRGWGVIALMSIAGFFLIMSFQYTLVANAVFFISLTPLIAALLAWFFLREAITRRTLIAMFIALLGVTIIFGTNVNGEGALGMGLAFLMATCYAGAIVTMRTVPGANVILLCALSGIFTAVLMLPIIDDFALSARDLMICLFLGIVQIGLGSALVFAGARHVPAAQVSILALVEVVLAPLWVWLFVSETPSTSTLIGGTVVLAGVIYQALGTQDVKAKDGV